MKILHIITSLGDGGAEHTLFKICKYDKKNKHIVISLKDQGKYFPLLKKNNTQVYCLNINFFFIHKIFFLIKLIRNLKPDIVQTWLVHSDFIGSIAARLANIKNIVWNVRYSQIELGKAKLTTIILIRILARLSFVIPKAIIIVSKRAKKIYKNLGYDPKKLNFIPNGYDLTKFKINKLEKINFKNKINIKKDIPFIGKVARYDPLKDHLNLLKSLSILRLNKVDFLCLLIGTNINRNKKLLDEIQRLKLKKHVKLFGPIKDISYIMSGLDIHILSSSSEGFPNVVAEAMAFQTPCVVTDVGDAPYIVGKTGWVVPPNDPKKLANAIKKAISLYKSKYWKSFCYEARFRIQKKFSINRMLTQYNKTWSEVYKKQHDTN